MAPTIEQHVAQGVAHLARRLQHVQVVALGQDPPRPLKDPVDRAGEARPDRFHPPAERRPTAGLDHQVDVVALDRVVDDPELAALARGSEGALDFSNELCAPE